MLTRHKRVINIKTKFPYQDRDDQFHWPNNKILQSRLNTLNKNCSPPQYLVIYHLKETNFAVVSS